MHYIQLQLMQYVKPLNHGGKNQPAATSLAQFCGKTVNLATMLLETI